MTMREVGVNRPPEITVAGSLQELIQHETRAGGSHLTVSIASAYFNLGGWASLKGALTGLGGIRLLLGSEPIDDYRALLQLRDPTQPVELTKQNSFQAIDSRFLSHLKQERDLLPFTQASQSLARAFCEWATQENFEVRRFNKGFLHGKAYIVAGEAAMAGSSNFTYAGLNQNKELNIGSFQPSSLTQINEWFEELWTQAEPFDLVAFYQQGLKPLTPWDAFLRMLWETYGEELAAETSDLAGDSRLSRLLDFQKDGVWRARRIIREHNGVLIADEVGLGKTYIGGELLRDAERRRQRSLVVAPKVIRDTVWRPYLHKNNLGGWVDVVSYNDLLTRNNGLPNGVSLNDYAQFLLDESHTVRNENTQTAQVLIETLNRDPRPVVILLTATPVNNKLMELHTQLSYFLANDGELAAFGIPSLKARFRQAEKQEDELSPEYLFGVLDRIAVRRTRPFIRAHYSGTLLPDTGKPIEFPDAVPLTVEYKLPAALAAFFQAFTHALGGKADIAIVDEFFEGAAPKGGLSQQDANRLTLAAYTPSRYRLDQEIEIQEITSAGLLRTGLLKRFESSAASFTKTCERIIARMTALKEVIEKEGLVVAGEALRDYANLEPADEEALSTWRLLADSNPAAEFDAKALLRDIESDIALLRLFVERAKDALDPKQDPKFAALVQSLKEIIEDAKRDAPMALVDSRKVIVFTEYVDTLRYLNKALTEEVEVNSGLQPYRGRIAAVHGSPDSKIEDPDEILVEFAPKSAGAFSEGQGSDLDGVYDLLISTDILSQGVNLQQARNIINYDLPWNPMRLVQRHGRIDRIGSNHSRIFLRSFFPANELEALLKLIDRINKKVLKASRSIGVGPILEGLETEDRDFAEIRQQIEKIRQEDATIYTEETTQGLISGEEFRFLLRDEIRNNSGRLEDLPWNVGSGFLGDSSEGALVFCAGILGRRHEPEFRTIRITTQNAAALLRGKPGTPSHSGEGFIQLRDVRLPLLTERLTALSAARPTNGKYTPTDLGDDWVEIVVEAWHEARQDIAKAWNQLLDPARSQPKLERPVRLASELLATGAGTVDNLRRDHAILALRQPQNDRIVRELRSILQDEALTKDIKAESVVQLVEDRGLQPAKTTYKRSPIESSDVHLYCWTIRKPIIKVQ